MTITILKVVLGIGATITWGLISTYFKVLELQKTVDRHKEENDKSVNGIGGKVYRLEILIMMDRMVDIAATKEEGLRQWKCGIFKEEAKR